jgi:hypothetical protein
MSILGGNFLEKVFPQTPFQKLLIDGEEVFGREVENFFSKKFFHEILE